ncbi:MAG: carbohydrate ABC transporter permease [Anaerolineae bacterium]|nr:carbohydrate ABC transporter permease [Anaerolineae bacterium]MDQ7035821.1 carbohydrate ABC transporter permease [Anaerolineae bacterium]
MAVQVDAKQGYSAENLVPTKSWGQRISAIIPHLILIPYSLLALFPLFIIIVNSLKDRRDLFRTPYIPPLWFSFEDGFHFVYIFSSSGYQQVFERANVLLYFGNSIVVTSAALFLILLTGSMISFALSEYSFWGSRFLALYMALGIMIPIRLGTVSLIGIVRFLGLYNSLPALILVYAASGLPIAVFVLTEYMRQVPMELKDAARVDGASEYRILFTLVMPVIRPALATVLVFNMLPIWNGLWFPLTLAPNEKVRTVTLGLSAFAGQYKTDWTALLAALTLAMIPVLILYGIFSRQFISGLTRGAVK